MARRETATGGRRATDAVVEGNVALSVGRPTRLPEPEGFKWTPLSSLARLESGHTPSRSKPEYWDGDIPWIGIRDATGNHGRVISDTQQHVTQAGIDNSSARVLPAGTVCLSRTASVGYVVEMASPMATSQDFVNWVCGQELSSSYLRYLLMLEQDSVRRFAYGSVHQTMYYPDAKALHALLPDRNQQQAIAEVLGALDDKIAANIAGIRAIWMLLEAEHRRLQSRAVPEGKRLQDVASLEYGKALPASARELGTVKVIGSGGASGTHSVALVGASGVVVGRKGTAGSVHWVSGRHFPIDTTFFVRGTRDAYSQAYLYFLLREARLSEMNNDSAVPGLNRSEALAIPILVPGDDDLLTFTAMATAGIELAESVERENVTLTAMRDALLPQLMSGTLRVRDAEAAACAAGA